MATKENKALDGLAEYRRKLESGEIDPPERGKPLNPREKLAKHLEEIKGTTKRPSRILTVNAKCFECQGEDLDKGWKWRVGNCEMSETCGLYSVRPYQKLHGTPMPIGLAQDLGCSPEEISQLRELHSSGADGDDENGDDDDE